MGSIPVGRGGLFKSWHAYAYTMEDRAELIDLPTMHCQLGHISKVSICAIMKSNAITGLCLINFSIPFSCNSCAAAKSTQKERHKYWQTAPATTFGDEVYSDLWVLPMESLGSWQYYVTFINNFLCYLSVNFLHSKSDTLQAYRAYTAWVNTQFGMCIKQFHSNHGSEYTVPPKTIQVFWTFWLDCMYLVNHGTYGHVHRLVRKPFITAF